MIYIFKRVIFCIVIFSTMVLEAESFEELLNVFSDKNALSQKTIDENKGHLYLFSRERLEKMQAETLKDVLALSPVLKYNENRFGLPDPVTSGSAEPFKSNFIRLYIDGIEITQGWMGSGMLLYGDMNIDFVDHIEIYLMTTSFEKSVEPAYATIFIYSKDPKRDSGGKLSLSTSNKGGNTQSINYGQVKKDYSYMLNYSHTKTRRDKVENGTSRPLSRDYERSQFFGYVKSEDQIFHLQVMKKETDSLAGLSYDATPLVSQIDYLNVHMDYGIKLSEYWRFQLTYDWLELDSYQADELPLIFYGNTFGNPLDLVTKNSTYGAELTYKNILGKHRITTGIKSRFKKFDSMIVQGSINVDRPFETETVTSLFFQDQYKLSEREFLTFGINYGIYKRNDVVGDEDLLQLRLGYIYSGDTWGYKTYLSRAMFTLDPLSRYFTGLVPKEVQTTVSFTQELSYKLEDNDMRLMFMVIKDKNGFADTIGSGDTKYYFTMFNDEYRFDNNNQINLQLFYGYYEDIFIFDSLKGYGGHLSFTNSYESLNFYNGFTWQKYESDERLMIDWTSAISWEPTSGLTLSLKGTNLLNKSQEGTVIRIDPVLGQALDPLKFQLLDRRIILEIEYSF